MSNFPVGETATAGLRVLKNRPVIILYWFGLMLLLSGAAVALIIPVFTSNFAELAAQNTTTPDPEQAMATFARMVAAFGLLIPLELVFVAVMATAANRAVLEPQRKAFGYLRLGMEELRTLVVMVCLALIVMVAYAVLVVAFAVLGAAAFGAGAASDAGPAAAILGVLFMVLLGIGVVACLIWFMTRMSLAVPQTFATKRINIFGSWSLTKGVTGRLFLAYLLAFLIYMALSMVGGIFNVIFMGGSIASMAMTANATTPPDLGRLFASMGPAMIANMIVSAMVAAAGTAVMICPSAAAYRELGGRGGREADVFA